MSTEEKPKRKVGRPKGGSGSLAKAKAAFANKANRSLAAKSMDEHMHLPVPAKAVTGTEMSWTHPAPKGADAAAQESSGIVSRPFDRVTAIKIQTVLKELKSSRADKATNIAVEALRMSSELIDEAHRKLMESGSKRGLPYWEIVIEYTEWCYMQGYAHYDPTDIVRWDARCSDRLLSCELYHLTLLARYLRLTFVELITPVSK